MTETTEDRGLEALLVYLARTRSFDFLGYKRTTLARRIQKRVQAVGVADFAAYTDYLEVHPDELKALFDAILINLTSFFRDTDAWAALRESLLVPLLARRAPDEPIRIWCAGCASGQEAYSLLMAVAEILGPEATRDRVKVYATDLDDDALSSARTGIYGAREIASVPPALLEKYFEPVGQNFEVRKDLRRAAIFGRHDLVRDAPISRVDLVSCRNTLMYLNSETQQRIASRFHFALRDDGALFLGKAEMLAAQNGLFSPLDLGARLFRRLAPSAHERRAALVDRSEAPRPPPSADALYELAFHHATVPQLVIDAGGHVALVNEALHERFGVGPDDIGRSLGELDLARQLPDLASLVEQARADRRSVLRRETDRTDPDGRRSPYDLHVVPLVQPSGVIVGIEVTFVDVAHAVTLQRSLQQANQELAVAYDELQATTEELETTNEELQSTVEELETTGEELQSTNEELETMNEELQSTNEELHAVNDELRTRGEELGRLNAFMSSVLAAFRSAVVVVDRQLAIEVWNREAEDLWGLRAEEVTRQNILGLDIGLPVEKLRAPIQACLAGETAPEMSLEATNRRGKAMRCVITFAPVAGVDSARGVLVLIDPIK